MRTAGPPTGWSLPSASLPSLSNNSASRGKLRHPMRRNFSGALGTAAACRGQSSRLRLREPPPPLAAPGGRAGPLGAEHMARGGPGEAAPRRSGGARLERASGEEGSGGSGAPQFRFLTAPRPGRGAAAAARGAGAHGRRANAALHAEPAAAGTGGGAAAQRGYGRRYRQRPPSAAGERGRRGGAAGGGQVRGARPGGRAGQPRRDGEGAWKAPGWVPARPRR